MVLPRALFHERIRGVQRSRSRQHTSILCQPECPVYGSYLCDGERLLSRGGAEYRSDPRSRWGGDFRSIIGTISFQHFSKLVVERGGARWSGQNRLYECIAAELHLGFDQAGYHLRKGVSWTENRDQ